MTFQYDIYTVGEGTIKFYHPCGGKRQGSEILDLLKKRMDHFMYIPFYLENWNDDLSPWAAPPVFGKEGFGGYAAKTLRWLTDVCIPQVEGKSGAAVQRVIGGYSLAGLFSLWSFYETGMFSGAASCSGSLWFPGWDEYMLARKEQCKGCVYLSLGDTEEMTKNHALQAVGNRTRMQYEWLRDDPGIEETILEWNYGGHFKDASARTARGFEWLWKNMQEKNVFR